MTFVDNDISVSLRLTSQSDRRWRELRIETKGRTNEKKKIYPIPAQSTEPTPQLFVVSQNDD